MTATKYILDEQGEPKLEPDTIRWGQWYETARRHVALDRLDNGVKVSTVFLGIDHNFGLSGPPVLWETMIFGGPHDQYQDRYTSREAAMKGHKHALQLARAARSPIRKERQHPLA